MILDKVLKYGGLACTVIGTLMTAFSSERENKKTLQKLVDETIKNKN